MVGRVDAEPRVARVVCDVAFRLDQLPVRLLEDVVKAIAEQVTAPAVAVVEGAGVAAVEELHPAGEVRLRRAHDQVVVRAHEGVVEDLPAVARHAEPEDGEE